MTIHAYLFEIRAIQQFLFSSGKLKDMAAGSELIDYLCHAPLAKALEICNLAGYHEPIHSPRCSGGVFYLLIEDGERAGHFRNLWSVMVTQLLPGVELIDALTSAASAREAISTGLEVLRDARNLRYPQLPAASPLGLRCPRTGEVAIARDQREPVDAATYRKREFRRPSASAPLVSRFCNEADYKWPDNFEAGSPADRLFPLGADNLVGLIHADGNGLGEILRTINLAAQTADDEQYTRLYRYFSDGLDSAMCKAAQAACGDVLLPASQHHVVPARPLVMGGDDLTLLVRADLAIPFVAAFLRYFEIETKRFVTDLREQMRAMNLDESVVDTLPDGLTACAGITYMKASQPFSQCYDLAEGLCARAKNASRACVTAGAVQMPSSLAFHKLQGSHIGDAEALFDLELVVGGQRQQGKGGLQIGLPVYGLDEAGRLPAIDSLIGLAACFTQGKLNHKRLRSIATLLHVDPTLASTDYIRWRALAQRESCLKAALEDFDQCLDQLLGSTSARLPADQSESSSPLADLLVYLSIHGTSVMEAEND